MAPEREQRILITQATPGMVLARPVTLPNGVVLCAAGTTLNDQLLQRLTLRGIKRLYVRGQPLPAPSKEPVVDRIRSLRRRFSRVEQVPVMAMIERAIEKEISRRS